MKVSNLPKIATWVLLLGSGCLRSVTAMDVTVSLKGKVVDLQGQGVSGAKVDLLETALTATSGGDGAFHLSGSFQVGLLRKAPLPGGEGLSYRQGSLVLKPVPGRSLEVLLVAPDGKSRRFDVTGNGDATVVPVDTWVGPGAGAWFLRLGRDREARTYRLIRKARGSALELWSLAGGEPRPALRKAGAVDSNSMVLEAGAAAFNAKRFHFTRAVDTGLTLTLVPKTATRKERIQDFVGKGNTFRIAFLKKDGDPTKRKHILHYVDFAEMTGDTLPYHAFPDSRGPETTPFGANVPSWAPDGKAIAYEIGAENQTVANVSRIFIQPLAGARQDGPAFPATNPRFWTDGKVDTALVWCTSGKEDGYKDANSRTYFRKWSGQALTGDTLTLAKSSYHGGLSADGGYLASAFRHGVMATTVSTATPRYFHIYPGHQPAAGGLNTDSLQACNPSISPDPARTSRMLFLDFGVPPGVSPYPNGIKPDRYAQHQMILIGDYRSEAPGRIVDFVDSPAEELAKGRTWDDPEWSNHPDFAVASTRDPEGDKSNPDEPKPTQPDIYIIHLPTKAALKVVSGDHMILPVLWVGKAP